MKLTLARRLGHEVHVVDGVGAAVKSIRPWRQRKKRLIQGLSFEQLIERIPRDSDVIGISCMFTHAWPMVRELMLPVASEIVGTLPVLMNVFSRKQETKVDRVIREFINKIPTALGLARVQR